MNQREFVAKENTAGVDPEIKQMIADVIGQANDAYDKEDYEGAIQKYNFALDLIGESTSFSSEQATCRIFLISSQQKRDILLHTAWQKETADVDRLQVIEQMQHDTQSGWPLPLVEITPFAVKEETAMVVITKIDINRHEKIQTLYKKIYGKEANFPESDPDRISNDPLKEVKRLEAIIDKLGELLKTCGDQLDAKDFKLVNALIAAYHLDLGVTITDYLEEYGYLTPEEEIPLSYKVTESYLLAIQFRDQARKKRNLETMMTYMFKLDELLIIDKKNAKKIAQDMLDFANDRNLKGLVAADNSKNKEENEIDLKRFLANANKVLNPPLKRKQPEPSATPTKPKKTESFAKVSFVGNFSAPKNLSVTKDQFLFKLEHCFRTIQIQENENHVLSEVLRELARYSRYHSDNLDPKEYGLFAVMLNLYNTSLSLDPKNIRTIDEREFYLQNEYAHYLNLTNQSHNNLEKRQFQGIPNTSLRSLFDQAISSYLNTITKLFATNNVGNFLAKLLGHLDTFLRNNLASPELKTAISFSF